MRRKRRCTLGGRPLGSKRELAELLEDVGLFSRCTTRQRRTVARHAQIAELPAGTDLVREGEPGDALFVILDGDAVVRRDGTELNRVGPGAYFGELAVIDGEPRSATVTAETDVRVAVIGIRMFRTLLREFRPRRAAAHRPRRRAARGSRGCGATLMGRWRLPRVAYRFSRAGCRDRTDDLLITNQLLYRLS